jgi:hypothetical protein
MDFEFMKSMESAAPRGAVFSVVHVTTSRSTPSACRMTSSVRKPEPVYLMRSMIDWLLSSAE